MRKLILLLILLSMSIINSNSSEIRVKGMSGKGNFDLYLVPDLWCDALSVNPAFAPLNKEIIINSNISTYVSYNYTYDKVKDNLTDEDDTDNYSSISVSPDLNYGMIIPINKFTFGFNVNYNSSYYRFNSEPNEVWGGNKNYSSLNIVQYYYLKGDLLFAWEINENLSLGLITEIKSIINYYNEYRVNKKIYKKGETPIDIYSNNSLGLLFSKENIKISFSIPFNYNYTQFKSPDDYSFSNDEWTFTKYTHIFYSGVHLDFDINVTDKVLFRIPIETGIEYTATKRHYTKAIYADNLDLKEDNNYTLSNFNFPAKTAFSINNKINDKVLLFYGTDLNFNISHEFEEDIYALRKKEINVNAGFFFGGEFQILKWFNIRAGINSIIFNYSFLTIDDNLYPENNYTYYGYPFSQSTDINLGFDFKPADNIKIELNTNLVNINFTKDDQLIDRYKYYKEDINNLISLQIDLGIVVTLNKKDKDQDDINIE